MIGIFRDLLRRLEGAGIPYMVVGSVASIVYGEARLTRDMDVVVDIRPEDTVRFAGLFDPVEFYCPPVEVLRQEVVERGQFNLLHQESGLKIDVVLRKDTEHGREEFSRRARVPFWEGFDAFLASPEDVIIKKLAFYREGGSDKHLADVRGILAETAVDKEYIGRWVNRLGLAEIWRGI